MFSPGRVQDGQAAVPSASRSEPQAEQAEPQLQSGASAVTVKSVAHLLKRAPVPRHALLFRLDAESEEEIFQYATSQSTTRSCDTPQNNGLARLTPHRLREMYMVLLCMGFSEAEIASGLKSNLGQPLEQVLNWLCIHIPRENLPSGLAQVYTAKGEASVVDHSRDRDSAKSATSVASAQGTATGPTDPKEASTCDLVGKPQVDEGLPTRTTNMSGGVEKSIRSGRAPARPSQTPRPNAQRAPPPVVESSKASQWNRAYLAQLGLSSSSDSELESGEDEANPATVDINALYRTLVTQMASLRGQAAAAKAANSGAEKRKLGVNIKRLRSRMGEIERHHSFVKPAAEELAALQAQATEHLATAAAPSPPTAASRQASAGENSPAEESAAEDAGIFSLFEDGSGHDEVALEGASSTPPFAELRKLDLATWSGITPKDLLGEWARRNYGKDTVPKYRRLTVGAGGRYRHAVTIQTGRSATDRLVVEGFCLAATAVESQHFVSMLALYRHAHDDGSRRRLPPSLRDTWDEWDGEKEEEERALESAALAPREQLVEELMRERDRRWHGMETSSRLGDRSWRPPAEVPALGNWEDAAAHTPPPSNSAAKGPSPVAPAGGQKDAARPSDAKLAEAFQRRQSRPEYSQFLRQRAELPVFAFRERILNTVRDNQVCVISGETGCGKTTQIPQYLAEELLGKEEPRLARIICTQPRRISAVSIAARVCEEMGDRGPGTPGSICGYQVRMDNKQSTSTRLCYCTTGIVLRRLQGDPELQGVDYLIVDEVHERTVQADFLLVILRRLLQRRADLKVILMSATMDSARVSQ